MMKIFSLVLLTVVAAEGNLRETRTVPAVALMHGLGDTCFGSTMQRWTTQVEATMQSSLVRCIPLGPDADSDAGATYYSTLQSQVDTFAEEVVSSPGFADGFNAIGFSQGTVIIRGYIQKYAWRDDYPSVFSFMAVHGPLMGVGVLPGCDPNDDFYPERICSLVSGVTSAVAYGNFIQNNFGPANYLRDPTEIEDYLTTGFLPYLNKEVESDDYSGMDILEQLVLVKADQETVVIPSESSWMGFYQDGSFEQEDIQSFTETIFYEDDMFGLKTLDEAGKVYFETTPGEHYDLSNEELAYLLNTYWLPNWKWENNEPIF